MEFHRIIGKFNDFFLNYIFCSLSLLLIFQWKKDSEDYIIAISPFESKTQK